MKPLPTPNWNAKPIAQYRMPHTQVSNTHDISTFTGSRDRAKPASSAMKPACMKNTRKAVTSTQTVFTGLTTWSACDSRVLQGRRARGGLEEPREALDRHQDGGDPEHLPTEEDRELLANLLLLESLQRSFSHGSGT